ncbi:MAG: hypothetical protein QM692_09540 [Thermomicrobiales bacterium]
MSDGQQVCCLTGGCCESDADCCGEQQCIGVYDIGLVCGSAPRRGGEPGAVCAADAECTSWPGYNAVCKNQRCQCENPSDAMCPDVATLPLLSNDNAALRVAEFIVHAEVVGNVFALYRSMHPDAQALIPQDAVVGWYQNEFLHFGEPAPRAVKLRFAPWTWEVTGQTYPEAAEVATLQTLEDGTEVWDAVRLVKDDNGNWCWFFGRSRQFVVEQLNRFVNPDPNARPVFLGESCSETLECSQSRGPAKCAEATREGVRQRVCLYGPNGYCTSTEDCHQEDGRTECAGETRGGNFSGVCLRAAGATCKSSRDCMESLTCVTGRCTPAA